MKSQETCGTGHTKKNLALAAIKSCFSCTHFSLASLGAASGYIHHDAFLMEYVSFSMIELALSLLRYQIIRLLD